MLKLFNRQKSLSNICKKNYTIAPDFNHYRDVRLHDKYATDIIVKEVKRLRELSPLWEMAQEGVDISKIKWAHH